LRLGSLKIQFITNNSITVVETLSFDPCLATGALAQVVVRRRNAVNWSYTSVPTSFLFDRGYTGHEHLDKFGLINMNGRLFDPAMAHFLSPDNFVQAPGATQSYNRYGYCMNNPMKFTDPSGYLFKEIFISVFSVSIAPAFFLLNLIMTRDPKDAFNEGKEIFNNLADMGAYIDNAIFKNNSTTTNPNDPKTPITGHEPFSTPYDPVDGDITIPFPMDLTKQNNANICFTTSMEYLSFYYGGKYRREDYANYYMNTYNDPLLYFHGILETDKAISLLSRFFNIKETNDYDTEKSIDAGNPIMTSIYTGMVRIDEKLVANFHNVVIIGYNNKDNTLIIANPLSGEIERISSASLHGNYLYMYQILGIKPED
jgi:RHS repeat-associated protein